MKKFIPILTLLVLLLASVACGTGSQPAETPTPVETDACCLNEPVVTLDEPGATQVPAASEEPSATEEPQTSGLPSGWYPYVNANVVRDLVVYDGVVYAATLGGMVAWRLDSGYSMKYTPIDGMSHISAYSIAYCEIPEPRILVGTLNGISIYDLNTGLWEQRALFPADSRVDVSKIERLYCDQANNRLLIGYNGLGMLDLGTGEFLRYTKNEGLLWESVTDITVKGQNIWIASGYKGIARIANGKVTTYTAENGLGDEYAYSLASAPDGTLWIGASSELISFRNNEWVFYDADSPAKLSNIYELEIASDGKIWAATLPLGTGRLCQFEANEASCLVDYTEMDGQGIMALALAEDGTPVYGTNKGVYVFSNGSATPLKTDDQLASNFVDSFASAPDGSLWIGTDSGLHLLDPGSPADAWQTFRQQQIPEMGGNWASGIAVAPDGTLWAAIINGSASRYQNGAWTAFKDIYSYNTVAVDDQGRAWFGDDGKGIIVLNPDGSQAMQFTTANGLPGDNVQALLTDLSGRVWIGTDQGLAKYENNSLEVVFGKDDTQLPNKYIRALALSPEGALIIGMFTGVARYDGTQVETLIDFLQDGLSDVRLTTLAAAPDGSLWVGTDKGLLYSYDLSEWTRLTTQDGLLTNYISALAVDRYGAVWIGGGGSNFDGGGILLFVP